MLALPAACSPATQGTAEKPPHTVQRNAPAEQQPAQEEKIDPEAEREKQASELVAKMSTEEKVAQIFVVSPESAAHFSGTVTAAGEVSREAFNARPVGGIVYSAINLDTPQQTKQMLETMQKTSLERLGLPLFTCVDEEGGTVARVSGQRAMGVESYPDMREVGDAGDLERAEQIGAEMGKYLTDLGFNVDFAPVADVVTNPDNYVVDVRAFGSDPQLVADMDSAFTRGLHKHPILATYKHFPGHGSTAEDSHAETAIAQSDKAAFENVDLLPFKQGIADGVQLMMVGHITFPNINDESVPASLSEWALQDVAREQLGFEGILITDSMQMGAITNHYSASEAAVASFRAGIDMILMPADFDAAYEGILAAVRDGTISQQRLDESLVRIIKTKLDLAKK